MPFCLSHARLGVYAKDGLPLGTISMNPLSLSHARFGVYAKDGLPLGTISMNPLSLSHIRIGVCTLAKTFFCGWGPQKHERGAPWFQRVYTLSA